MQPHSDPAPPLPHPYPTAALTLLTHPNPKLKSNTAPHPPLPPSQAHLFYVPIYLSSLYMHPVNQYAEEPYIGRKRRENRRRSHQGSLLMLRALRYIRSRHPYWDQSGGSNHIWLMLHDEGPCFCPRAIRPSVLLTHYGYWSETPKAWGNTPLKTPPQSPP